MRDYLACPGIDCPMKEKCLRYYKPSLGDTYYVKTPYDHESNSCKHYLDHEIMKKRKQSKVIDGTPYFNKR